MKIASVLVTCLGLIGCGGPTDATLPATPEGMTRVPDGKFVFALPTGWFRMPNEAWYTQRGFSAAFQKGEDPSIPSSYFLIQVKQQKKWSANALQALADKAVPLQDVHDLKDYISSGKHKTTPELYVATMNVFVIVQDYPDSHRQSSTVMVKRFCENHYVVIHFYLRDKLESDVGVIANVLSAITFDEDRHTRTTPSTRTQ